MPRWFLWTLLALFSWGIWAILSKLIGNALSPAHSQALSTIGLLPVMLALGLSSNLRVGTNRRRGAWIAFAAGLLSSLGNIAYYRVLDSAKAATVVPLTALYPLVTVLLAVTFLKEHLNRIQSAGIVLSLAAIYLLNVQQEQGFFSASLAVALIPIALWGVTGLLQKLATNDASGELVTQWFLAAFIPVAVLILLQQPMPKEITLKTWMLVLALGFTLALGNFAVLAAFASDGKASIITPLSGLYPAVSIPIAILMLGEHIGWRETVGIGLSLAAVAALSCESKPARSDASTLKSQIPP